MKTGAKINTLTAEETYHDQTSNPNQDTLRLLLTISIACQKLKSFLNSKSHEQTTETKPVNFKFPAPEVTQSKLTLDLVELLVRRWFMDDEVDVRPSRTYFREYFSAKLTTCDNKVNELKPPHLEETKKTMETQVSFSSLQNSFTFFRRCHTAFLIENRHANPVLQNEYDKQFGLTKGSSA